MTALTFPAPRLRLPLLAELVERQRALTLFGLALLLIAVPAIALQAVDGRTLASGVNVWVKPAKFLVSVGVFALTSAWFFGYVRPERRSAPLPRAAVAVAIVAGTFEIAYIVFQAAQGLDSHFNETSPFHAVMYGLMGLFAVLLVSTVLPLAWEIARRPAAGLRPDFVAAVVAGLVLTFLLGGGLGGYMSAQAGHSVGAQGAGLPVFGWNRMGGDLRVAHFLGIHAEQALPILAALIGGFAARTRWWLLGAGSAAYVAVTLGVFWQAVAGRPLLPL
ncbi:MAG: hypothetical protein ACK4K7_13885 [Allosphingosinicella sp.]|uniref:hypothetical protein n=1 Tax=Allosphingosinicella sp. TaxID=2823234 RepID=UPI0039306A2D